MKLLDFPLLTDENIDPDLEPPFFITAERLNNKLRIKVRNALPGPS